MEHNEERVLKTLDEILPAVGLTKYHYWQLRYRGAELPREEGYRRNPNGGRPQKLYDPEKVIAAVERYRIKRGNREGLRDRIRSALKEEPMTVAALRALFPKAKNLDAEVDFLEKAGVIVYGQLNEGKFGYGISGDARIRPAAR